MRLNTRDNLSDQRCRSQGIVEEAFGEVAFSHAAIVVEVHGSFVVRFEGYFEEPIGGCYESFDWCTGLRHGSNALSRNRSQADKTTSLAQAHEKGAHSY